MDVSDLITEQLVVHLVGTEDAGQRLRHPGDFLHQRGPLGRREREQLGRVTLQHQHRPAGKELIIVEVRNGLIEVGDPLARLGPLPCAG